MVAAFVVAIADRTSPPRAMPSVSVFNLCSMTLSASSSPRSTKSGKAGKVAFGPITSVPSSVPVVSVAAVSPVSVAVIPLKVLRTTLATLDVACGITDKARTVPIPAGRPAMMAGPASAISASKKVPPVSTFTAFS